MHRDQTECWLAARKAELLPCPYFHITVTVPAELRDVLRTNQRDGYAALMQATAVVPTAALANLVRGKMQALLKKRRPDLVVPEAVWRKPWVVHCTAWGNGADAVLQYLARYVFRIAITSSRIVGLDDNGVTIRHRVRASGRWLRTRLRGHEFMRRFLQHVLPRLASGDMATGICRPREPSLAKSEPARRACSAGKPRAEVEREGHGAQEGRELFVLAQHGALEVGAEDMMAVLDLIDDSGELAAHPAVKAPAEDRGDLVCGQPRPSSQARSNSLWIGKFRLKMTLWQYSIWAMAMGFD
jgi:Putative transposase